MRSFLLSFVLVAALSAACSKQAAPVAPAPAAPAPAAPAPGAGLAAGEPNPAAPGARPASISDADVAIAERAIDLMAKLSAAVTSAGSNCQQAATEIRTIVPELKAGRDEGKQLFDKLRTDAAASEWFEKTYNPRLEAATSKLLGNPCMNDPAIIEALGEIEK